MFLSSIPKASHFIYCFKYLESILISAKMICYVDNQIYRISVKCENPVLFDSVHSFSCNLFLEMQNDRNMIVLIKDFSTEMQNSKILQNRFGKWLIHQLS